jgi:hypothetical protein
MIDVKLLHLTISTVQNRETPVVFLIETLKDFFLKAKNFMDVLSFTV